jgi:CRP-like cAMP-binding protein
MTFMENRLLSSLSVSDLAFLTPHLSWIALPQGAVLHEPKAQINTVYFPLSGAVSLLAVMNDGQAIEIACVGREGAVGLSSASALRPAFTRAVVQVPGFTMAIPSSVLRAILGQSEHMRDIVARYGSILFAQTQQLAACNALHSVEERLARWLLQLSDRTGAGNLSATHGTISRFLGVRRTTVTLVARELQRDGIIHYHRGNIEIRDPKWLQSRSCECYDVCRRAEGLFEQHDLPATGWPNEELRDSG